MCFLKDCFFLSFRPKIIFSVRIFEDLCRD